jgi:hypothetical protein
MTLYVGAAAKAAAATTIRRRDAFMGCNSFVTVQPNVFSLTFSA